MTLGVTPIGTVSNERDDPADTDHWGAVVSTIHVDARFPESCLQGLEQFSHAEIVFIFDRAEERADYQARPPRGRADLPAVGVFADRGPRRPNRLGVTTCEIVSVGVRRLTVRGLDAINHTPVLDIKPAMQQLVPRDVQQPRWVDTLMADYRLP